MNNIPLLQDLSDIARNNRKFIYKQSLCKSKKDYNLVCDYMQKVNYCIQDLNRFIGKVSLSKQDVVYIIALVTWIREAVYNLKDFYIIDIEKSFIFSKHGELEEGYDYIKALRSYAVAHPLKTNQQGNFKEINGKFICIDIKIPDSEFFIYSDKNYGYINPYGYFNEINNDSEIYLYGYISENRINNPLFIGFSLNNIYSVARLYIERLYELDKFLQEQKAGEKE